MHNVVPNIAGNFRCQFKAFLNHVLVPSTEIVFCNSKSFDIVVWYDGS